MIDFYQKNIDLLRELNAITPTTLKVLEKASNSPSLLEVRSTEQPHCIDFSVMTDQGKSISLHSRRDPIAEGKRQVERWLDGKKLKPGALAVSLGLGGGFHLKAIVDKFEAHGTLLIIDPHPTAVFTALHHIDLAELPQNKPINIVLITNEDVETISSEFHKQLTSFHNIAPSFFLHPGCARAFPKLYVPLPRRLAAKTRAGIMLLDTKKILSKVWLANAISNIPAIVNSTPLDAFKDKFKDLPALVVAAGPSLAASLDLIREMQDRAVIITVGTAYRPLRRAGIRPHFITLVDGSPLLKAQFTDVRLDDCYLIGPPQIHPDIFKSFEGNLITCAGSALPHFDQSMRKMGCSADLIKAAGTVTASAIDTAVYFGCKHIYTFGLDLAFQDDGKSHVKDSMHEDVKEDVASLISVPGNWRDKVLTSKHMSVYIEFMADMFNFYDNLDIELHNVNNDGAAIRGMSVCKPTDLSAEDFASDCQVQEKVDKLFNESDPRGDKPHIIESLQMACIQLTKLSEISTEAARLCTEFSNKSPYADSPRLKHLCDLEEQLCAPQLGSLLCDAALQEASMKTLSSQEQIADGKEKSKLLMKDSARFYGVIKPVAEWTRDRIEVALSALEHGAATHCYEREIPAPNDFELGLERTQPLKYQLTIPATKEPEGIVFLMHGVGCNNESDALDSIREVIACKFNMAVVNVFYHSIKSRPTVSSGAKMSMSENDTAAVDEVIKNWKLSTGGTIEEKLYRLDTHLESLKTDAKELPEGLTLQKTLQLSAELIPGDDDYRNAGPLQALDHLAVLYDLKKEFNLPLTQTILVGAGHGAYIGQLLTKIAPLTFTALFDNCVYTKMPDSQIMGRELNKPEWLCSAYNKQILPNLSFQCFIKTLWNSKKGPHQYKPDHSRMRSMNVEEDLKKMCNYGKKKTQYRFYHAPGERNTNNSKAEFTKQLKKHGFNVRKKKVDAKDFVDVFKAFYFSLKVPRITETDIDLQSTIRYAGKELEYIFRFGEDGVSAEVKKIEE